MYKKISKEEDYATYTEIICAGGCVFMSATPTSTKEKSLAGRYAVLLSN